jgi:hypothetical protein
MSKPWTIKLVLIYYICRWNKFWFRKKAKIYCSDLTITITSNLTINDMALISINAKIEEFPTPWNLTFHKRLIYIKNRFLKFLKYINKKFKLRIWCILLRLFKWKFIKIWSLVPSGKDIIVRLGGIL